MEQTPITIQQDILTDNKMEQTPIIIQQDLLTDDKMEDIPTTIQQTLLTEEVFDDEKQALRAAAALEPTEILPEYQVDIVAETNNDIIAFDSVSQPLDASPAYMSGATKLKNMIEQTDELIVCPGVYDGLSARIALRVGFSAMYMTGAGTTASRLGQPDLGIAHLHDMKEHAEMIANLDPYGPPLIADMDTGYGGPIMIANSVKSYIRAGVAGFHIEDQIMNKRCGHLKGKRVVPAEEFYTRVSAAKAAKDAMHSDIVLIARTDALQMHGYDECIQRLKTARDIGADVGLLEGYTSKEMAARAVKDLAPWPILLNMVENGATPVITTKEAKEMGFRIMIFSFASLAPAYVAIQTTLERLKSEGVVGTGKDVTPLKIFDMCGLKDLMAIDTDAGGSNFANGI
ncbi:hypothetical protein V497_07003 [Pseudogymnoascus sp. VKM F-4516 (FW-969)]|nr:hypothetical protein V490_00806 [Pseudogymnoascus sp. VKM F-3557]KFY55389.1 hypothetical protein V497_07003 [Pseudogymnoascus sp. VKM F-4516 (FW-969)]